MSPRPVSTDKQGTTADPNHPLHKLTPEQLEELGREFQAIHDEVYADLGERDAEYIRGLIRFHRRLAAVSRIALLGSGSTIGLVAGTAGLSVAKILENMEIGHNVLHGQWDWMNDPKIHSSTWEWDSASPSSSWKHSHNYVHHTYTNVIGKDKDVGYEIMRVDERQPWKPAYLGQPIYNLLLAALFEWGVAFHDLDLEAMRNGEKPMTQVKEELRGIVRKAMRQVVKDYIAFPLLSGRNWRRTLAANATANVVRNVWAYAIIFCGHFPDQAYTFTEEEAADESMGAWYVRQLIGAANIEGGDTFHLMSGNLSFQVEHHLFPDMPSSRYKEIAPRVKDICDRYELPYNTGPFLKQFGSVQRSLLRLAFPGGFQKRKPGPYVAPEPPASATETNPLRRAFPQVV
ncbi:acyl-CoA desaturase [Nocardioides albidus]|uniref:Acyl-CoA desaturase n=1 Tax=Nocardioides albidus TaxID=1517589 RepID=A0A5C4WDL2_9ACTN|nr:acyl-CoA desaturase [Nocardioides albidus]TNM46132.1 acyl-CoA desaturase [Nocardioides albidus]